MAVLKYKSSDGTYKTLNNYSVKNVSVLQSIGDSTEAVMSQKAVTDVLTSKADSETVSQLQSSLESDYVTTTDLSEYAKSADIESVYASKTEVASEIASATEDMATNTDINIKITPITESVIESTFFPNKEVVDLGLPSGLLWTTCNLGARSQTEYGLYYSWGETEGYVSYIEKGGFNQTTYKFWGGSSFTNMTKYNDTDGLSILEPQDDAATVMLGEGFRMPTMEEFQELLDNTTNEWVTNYQESNVRGKLFKGKGDYADRELFFPTRGYISGTTITSAGNGYYHSSSLITSGINGCRILELTSTTRVNTTFRYFGLPIRAVLDKKS